MRKKQRTYVKLNSDTLRNSRRWKPGVRQFHLILRTPTAVCLLCFPQHVCLNIFTNLWKYLEKCFCCLIPHVNGNFMAVLEINIFKLENILLLFPLQKQMFKTQSNILPVIWNLITFLWKNVNSCLVVVMPSYVGFAVFHTKSV